MVYIYDKKQEFKHKIRKNENYDSKRNANICIHIFFQKKKKKYWRKKNLGEEHQQKIHKNLRTTLYLIVLVFATLRETVESKNKTLFFTSTRTKIRKKNELQDDPKQN